MADPPRKMTSRRVVSEDPSLSYAANRHLTDGLRTVIGSKTAQVPASRSDHTGDIHAKHSSFVANFIDLRLGGIVTALVVLIVAAVVAVNFGGVLILIAAAALLLLATAAVVLATTRLTRETEHVAPETAAALVEEGVGDPDGVFTDLVADFTTDAPSREDRGAA
ncbi:MAG: hypothetical protein NVS2B6_09470 [Thermoleophilaceae bacterium]